MKRLLSLPVLGVLLVAPSYGVQAAEKLSDAQVSKILTATNDGEVLLAQHVMSHTSNPKVKEFARHMIDDHSLNNVMNRNIASKEEIVPEDSKKSEEIQEKGEMTEKSLMNLKGHDLDVAYMDGQVKNHQMVLNDLNTTLIPATKDSELRAHLTKTAQKVQMHLNEAKQVRQSL